MCYTCCHWLQGFSNFEWKTVTMVYDGKMITGVVESANLKYMQQQFGKQDKQFYTCPALFALSVCLGPNDLTPKM